MRRFVASLIALSLVSGTAHAAEGDPVVFKPSGGWAADFGDDYCRLVRTFSDGTNEISLAIERMQPASFAKILLVGDGIKLYRRADSIGYSYLPAGEGRTGQLFRSESPDGQQLLILDGANIGPNLPGFGRPSPETAGPAAPPPAPGTPLYTTATETEYASAITGLMLTDGTVTPVTIETGSLKNPIGVLQDCTYDLLSFWKIDGAKHRTLSRTVVPQSGTTLPPRTIDFRDFGKLGGGANQVRVMIDATGAPTSCTIHSASLGDTTNGKICNHLMKNAKFLPALDAEGQAIASYWITSPFFLLGPPPGG